MGRKDLTILRNLDQAGGEGGFNQSHQQGNRPALGSPPCSVIGEDRLGDTGLWHHHSGGLWVNYKICKSEQCIFMAATALVTFQTLSATLPIPSVCQPGASICAGPSAWNALLSDIYMAGPLTFFRSLLKFHLIREAFLDHSVKWHSHRSRCP